MLVVKVELHSAVTGEIKEIARAVIYNDTENAKRDDARGDYVTFAVRDGGDMRKLSSRFREARIENYPRKELHVFNLVARCLNAMGFR